MSTKLSSHDEIRSYEDRYKYLYIMVGLFFAFVMLRLWYLQLYKGNEFFLYAERNRMWQEKDRAPRGMIFDRNGKLLVDNQLSFDVVIRSQYLEDEDEEDGSKKKEETLKKLSELIKVPLEDIKLKLLKSKNLPVFYPVVVAEDVDRDKLGLIEANKLFMPGVDIIPRNKRVYLYGEGMAHLLGFIGEVSKPEMNKLNASYDLKNKKLLMGDYIGKFGLEKAQDLELRGIDGAEYVIIDANGRMKSAEEAKAIFGDLPSTKSVPGNNLTLTIDSDLQNLAYKYFSEGNKKGAAIAIDPRSGEVLVMFSYPSFDPTVMSLGVTQEMLKELRSNPFRPFYNKTIQDHYSPGSTFKPLVALSALEEGAVDDDTKITCQGKLWFGNRYFHCHKKEGHGTLGLHEGIVRSCDIVFYKLGIKLGVDKVFKYASKLGLSQRTGIELPDETSGLMPSSEWKMKHFGVKWMQGEDLSMAIGQGYDLVTPLQLVNLYAGIATGKVFKPYVIKAMQDVDGKTIWTSVPKVKSTLNIKPLHKEFLMKALWGVVNEQSGTAWNYRVDGLDIAGKTGTVQLAGISEKDIYKKCESLPEIKRYHGWFVGFAPYDKPEIAVAVIAEHSCHGSSGATPLVRDIIKAYYDKYGFDGKKDRIKTKDAVKDIKGPEIVE
jgi:penicillin-binding protein 2